MELSLSPIDFRSYRTHVITRLTFVGGAVVRDAVQLQGEEAVEEVVGDERDHQLVERRPGAAGLNRVQLGLFNPFMIL